MAEMGRYCKAYLASDLKKFKNWNPELANLRQPEPEKPNEEVEKRTELGDDDILYVQEDLIVTDGIFRDENVIFQDDSDAWKEFCEKTLEFAIPEDVQAIGAEVDAAGNGDGGEEEND